MQLGTKMI